MSIKNLQMAVVGMHCPNCVAKVTAALEHIRGVLKAEVSLEEQRADVQYDDEQANEEMILTRLIYGFGAKFDIYPLPQ